jgi:hypothetical protein
VSFVLPLPSRQRPNARWGQHRAQHTPRTALYLVNVGFELDVALVLQYPMRFLHTLLCIGARRAAQVPSATSLRPSTLVVL